MNQKFSVVCADPPWSFADELKHSEVKRGAAANYPTMSISEIKQLPVKAIADPDGAILCLWVPSALLKSGIEVMEAWGFQLKQSFIWVKVKGEPLGSLRKNYLKIITASIKEGGSKWDNIIVGIKDLLSQTLAEFSLTNLLAFNMGRIFRNTHEICLVGTNNNKIYQQLQNHSQRTVCFAPNLKHSAKPEELQNAIDIMFNGEKIELFARRERKGWQCLGNEVGCKEDIRVSLAKLL